MIRSGMIRFLRKYGLFLAWIVAAEAVAEETGKESFKGGLWSQLRGAGTIEEIPVRFQEGKLPRKVSHRKALPEPRHQGTDLSCVGWTVGYGLLSFLHNTPVDARNAHYVYHWALLNEMNETNQPIKDVGCRDLMSALQAIEHNGSCSLPDYADFKVVPKTPVVRNSKRFRALKTFSKFNDSNIESIKLALANGRVLPGGFKLYPGFIDQSSFRPRTHAVTNVKYPVWRHVPFTDIAREVGHAMLVTGYDDDLQAFEVMNSLGPKWGDGGFIWIDYGFFVSERCCEVLFTYDDSIEGLIAEAGGKKELEEGVRNGTIEGYAKLGWWRPDGQTEVNFLLGEAVDMEFVQKGMTLTVDPKMGRLRMRATVKTSDGPSPVIIGPLVGTLEVNDRVYVTELRKFIQGSGNLTEYWIKGKLIDDLN